MSVIVELEDISKHYGQIIGVDRVTLAVEDGEFLTLLGPSGCGKTTLLRVIAGFEKPTSGTVRLAGQNVTRLPPQKRVVNMMFQDYALFPHMTVGQNVAYGLKMKGIGRSEAARQTRETLDLVGLSDRFGVRPHQLSGGQRQRVALARAIVRRPKVLLLDEPLSALDLKLREQMQVELKHMQERLGITFIMVTHDQTEALVMSDRVVVMERGRIAQAGTPQELYEDPRSPYVANFIGTTNFLPAVIVASEGATATIRVAGMQLKAAAGGRKTGERIQIGFRPEKARLLNGSDNAPENILEGTVAEHIYHGTSLRTVVQLPDSASILIDTPLAVAMSRAAAPEIGSAVRVGIDRENIYLFKRENGL